MTNTHSFCKDDIGIHKTLAPKLWYVDICLYVPVEIDPHLYNNLLY